MSFNTSRHAINEVNGWVAGRLTNIRAQLKKTDKDDPMYEYLLERITYHERFIDARNSMIGKEMPPDKRAIKRHLINKG